MVENKDVSASVGSPNQGETYTGPSAHTSTGLSMSAAYCIPIKIMFLTGPICWRIADAHGIALLTSIQDIYLVSAS